MNFLPKLLALALISTCLSVRAEEDAGSLQENHIELADLLRRHTATYKTKLLKIVDKDEAAIIRQIIFDDPAHTPLRGWEIPSAYKDKKGRMHIRLSVGFQRYVLMTGIAATLHTLDPKYDYAGYVFSFGRTIHDNLKRQGRGEPLKTPQTPIEFFKMSQLEYRSIANTSEFEDRLTGFMTAVEEFVLAHEIAHHVLGHFQSDSNNLEESRQRERAADEWAIEVAFKTKDLPVGGLLFAFFMLSTRGSDIVFEHLETHPADFRRLDYVVEAIAMQMERARETLESAGYDVDAFAKQMKELHRAMRSEFQKSIRSE